MVMGKILLEESIQDGSVSFWECPFCGSIRVLEQDAEGDVVCWECDKTYQVKDIICMF